MRPIELDAEELSYLLSVFRAETVSGLEGFCVLPADLEARGAARQDGRRKVRNRGWLTPVGSRGQMHLDDEITSLVAALVDPDLVLTTVRCDSAMAPSLCLHSFAGRMIVELIWTAQRHCQLTALSSLHALGPRLNGWLALEEPRGASMPAAFSVDARLLPLVERLASAGQLDAAAAALRQPGAESLDLRAFLAALANAGRGRYDRLTAARTRGRETLAERKATLLRGGEMAWLLERPDADRTALRIATIRSGTLARLLADWIEGLLRRSLAGPTGAIEHAPARCVAGSGEGIIPARSWEA